MQPPVPRRAAITLLACAVLTMLCVPVCSGANWKGDFAEAPRRALVIGNANYKLVGALKNPLNDARDICDAMKRLRFEATCRADIASRVEMRSVVQDFVDALPAHAVVVVYYAGHAVQVSGENYLVPTGAAFSSDRDLIAGSVDLSFIVRQLRRVDTSLNVMILDACRDNPLTEQDKRTLEGGLAQVSDVPDRSVVLYATAANGLAADGSGRNGVLTKHLLAGLKDPGTVDELFRKVSSGVQQETEAAGRAQKPALYTNFSGQFCFAQCTDMQWLQRQKQDAAEKIAELQSRLDSGDKTARAELDRAQDENARLTREMQRKDAEARKAQEKAEEKKKTGFVFPGI
jgi:uncharacterized caspase-like protein